MSYEVTGRIISKVYIDSSDIAKILNEEKEKLLGGSDRYISEGTIFESARWTETVGQATEEQVELYNALKLLTNHFSKKGNNNG